MIVQVLVQFVHLFYGRILIYLPFLLLNAEILNCKLTALVEDDVQLPCNITSLSGNDVISTIFWYKGDTSGSPIYTVDSRNSSSIHKASHFSSELLRNRASFNLSLQFATLLISPVKEEDSGEYRCRVDFRWSRTMNTVIQLEVIVPPRKLAITDHDDHELSESVSSYGEEESLSLKCTAYGGKPPPTVKWYQDWQLIDDSYSTRITEDGPVSINELTINKLGKSSLNKVIACKASNSNLTSALVRSFVLDINLHPSAVKITSIKRPLSASKLVEIKCVSKGSRPAAKIVWFVGIKPLTNFRETYQEESNGTYETNSVLNFVPSSVNNGQFLICRSENPRLSSNSLADKWLLNVYDTPKVQLFLRSSTASHLVSEEEEVIFECIIESNPIVQHVGWLHNNDILDADLKHGIVIENTTLVIKKVKKHNSGEYSCFAENIEGKNESNKVKITVNYVPVCDKDQIYVYSASIGEMINLTCSVDAFPPNVKFWWGKDFINTNNYLFTDNSTSNYSLQSVLQLKLQSSFDYINYWCKARNSIGDIKSLCVFRILPKDPPDKLKSCSINAEDKFLAVDCFTHESSSPALYHVLELYEVGESRRLVKHYNNTLKPSFKLQNIDYNSPYWLKIYSANQAGLGKESILSLKGNKSEPIPLYISDPLDNHDTSSPLFRALIIILIISISIMAAVLLVIIMVRRKIAKNVISQPNSSNSIASLNFNSDSAPTPDIIPSHEFGEFELSNKIVLMKSIKDISEEFYPTTQVSLQNGAFTICDLPVKIIDNLEANHGSVERRSTLV